MDVAVFGVGNRFRRDDAVGLVVAERLTAGHRRPDLMVRQGLVWELGEAWLDADVAVVVDAMASSDAPGTIRRYDLADGPLPRHALRCSTHGFGVADAIELARSRGRLPRRLIVYGVVGSCFDHGCGMSAPVERAVDVVVDRILGEVDTLRRGPPGAGSHA
ncbi:MAG: hydrogenase maturation protease [Nitrospirota bacterium]